MITFELVFGDTVILSQEQQESKEERAVLMDVINDLISREQQEKARQEIIKEKK